MLPIKMPYERNGLSGMRGDVRAGESLQVAAEYTLCVNPGAGGDEREAAQDFVDWLAADDESQDAVQRSLAYYVEKGAALPLAPAEDEDAETVGIAAFGADVYGQGLRALLSDSDWSSGEKIAIVDIMTTRWLAGGAQE
jgi:hypothetical protein